MKQRTFTIAMFNQTFPNDAACLDVLRDHIYPDGITCRSCKEIRPHHRLTQRRAYSCDYCGTHVYVLAGTIFAKTTTPLTSWFYAMFLMGSTRCGISAKQLERELGVTYKTAWRMFKQIRSMLGDDASRKMYGALKSTRLTLAAGVVARRPPLVSRIRPLCWGSRSATPRQSTPQ